jgi:hypothetical protein
MSNATTAGVLWANLMLGAANATGQTADDRWQFGSAPSFSSGKYGTDTRTDVLYTPVTARRLFDDGDLTLVFPFTCVPTEKNQNCSVTSVTSVVKCFAN